MRENLKKALLLGIIISGIGIAAHNEIEEFNNINLVKENIDESVIENCEIVIIDQLTNDDGISYRLVVDEQIIDVGYVAR